MAAPLFEFGWIRKCSAFRGGVSKMNCSDLFRSLRQNIEDYLIWAHFTGRDHIREIEEKHRDTWRTASLKRRLGPERIAHSTDPDPQPGDPITHCQQPTPETDWRAPSYRLRHCGSTWSLAVNSSPRSTPPKLRSSRTRRDRSRPSAKLILAQYAAGRQGKCACLPAPYPGLCHRVLDGGR